MDQNIATTEVLLTPDNSEIPQSAPIPTICPSCKNVVDLTYNFCPTCGRKLKNAPIFVSLTKEVWIYCVSLFLPPFGLRWAKYMGQSDPRIKRIGALAIILTVLSTAVTILLAISITNSLTTTLNNQLNSTSNLGL